MTPQEMLNKAYEGVLDQGVKSLSIADDTCVYRGENGTRCAVGHLIDDTTASAWDEVDPQDPGTSIRTICRKHSNVPTFILDNLEFLVDLQMAHDCISSRAVGDDFEKVWNKQVSTLAELYDLESPVVEYEDL